MKRPRVLPYLQVVTEGDSIHLHGRPDEVWSATGKSVDDLLRLLPLLDGTRTVPEAAHAAAVAPELAEQIVAYLKELGLVAESPEIPEPVVEALRSAPFRSQLNYLAMHANNDPVLGASRLVSAHVLLLGNADWMPELATALRAIGVGEITHVDEHGGRIPDSAALAIVSEGAGGPSVFRRAAEALDASKTPWLRLSICSDNISVGPIFIPGETACYACYEARYLTNVSDPEHQIPLYRHHRASGYGHAGDSFAGAKYIAVGMASLAVLKYLTRIMPCEFVAHEYTLNLNSLGSELRPLLKVPTCTRCVAERRPVERLTTYWEGVGLDGDRAPRAD